MSYPIFLVGTRFQAVMANAIRKHCGFDCYDLVYFHHCDPGILHKDVALQTLSGEARAVTAIDRLIPTLAQFQRLSRAIESRRRIVLLAQISNPFILAVFRINPALRLQTFDEGSYNVAPKGPFFAPAPRRLRAPRDLLAWALFPKGPLAFARARSERHYSAFPPERNVMSGRAVRVHVSWEEVALPEEVAEFRNARRIMVLPCMKDFRGPESARTRLLSHAPSCDLVVRHPRDPVLPDVSSVRLKSPVEGIACALSARAPLTVLHYGSTVGLTLEGRAHINLVDLSQTAAADLEGPDA